MLRPGERLQESTVERAQMLVLEVRPEPVL
jgi:hypothetical protein